MGEIKAVLFDMDGVLLDSMKYHIESWLKAFHKFEILVTENDLKELGGVNFTETIEILATKYGVNLLKEERVNLHNYKVKIFEEIYKINIYPNIIEVIQKLRKNGLKIALVTGSIRSFTNDIVNNYFVDLFDLVITAEDTLLGKPNPDPYLKAVNDLNLNSFNCLVVEDSIMGIKSGNSANCITIGIATTLSKEKLIEANQVFENHDDLFKYLLSL